MPRLSAVRQRLCANLSPCGTLGGETACLVEVEMEAGLPLSIYPYPILPQALSQVSRVWGEPLLPRLSNLVQTMSCCATVGSPVGAGAGSSMDLGSSWRQSHRVKRNLDEIQGAGRAAPSVLQTGQVQVLAVLPGTVGVLGTAFRVCGWRQSGKGRRKGGFCGSGGCMEGQVAGPVSD